MTQRNLISMRHWMSVILILIMVKGGTSAPWALWLFVIAVALWAGVTVTKGMLGRPGPNFSPGLRRSYPWTYRALHIAVSLTAVAIFFRLIGWSLAWLDAWTMLLVTLSMGTFHGLFHFWRHTALYNGALRLIMSRFMYKWL